MPTTPRLWHEPTSLLPLKWGTYRERLAAGLLLIVAGGIALSGTNTWSLPLLAAGSVTHAVGWLILPASGWRRIVVVVPGLTQIWLLLAGPQSVWTFTIGLACWLLVRHRPPRAWVTLLLPIGNSILLPEIFEDYTGMLPALAISLAVTVGAAWLARLIAAGVAPKSPQSRRSGTALG
jgi:hypothetical protein